MFFKRVNKMSTYKILNPEKNLLNIIEEISS